jgi:hypothetical protein
MNDPSDEHHHGEGTCSATGRRRAASSRSQRFFHPTRRGDECVDGQPIRRGDTNDAPPIDPASELEAFAGWFADWWLRRGRELTATGQGGHDE